ncbi:MAG: histidine--tRNA ligase [Spirochaetales bacterium]|nr:histidine--tRNA ligase [Spirochaetales bacterium]
MIEPRVLKGFRDTLPSVMIDKKELIGKLERIFRSYGLTPIDTPALEYTEILLGKGGGETDKQIYRFRDNGDRDVSMRFDLTVPLARFVSEHYNELPMPFKRYHIAPVWRGENTQKGRYREFYQCDFDILGSDSIYADIDILLMIKAGFDAIQPGEFRINVNHRKVLNAVLRKLGIEDKVTDILRTIDKIYKIGADAVKSELGELGLTAIQVDGIIDYLHLDIAEKGVGITGDKIFGIIDELNGQIDDEGKKWLDQLRLIFTTVKELGIGECFSYNPAITRGLDYYTGIVFESFVLDRIQFGSVCSGGRYDNLTALYSKTPVSGVGASFGLDRLLALLEDKNMLSGRSSDTDILILNQNAEYMEEYQKAAQLFRKDGLSAEIFFDGKKIIQQYKYAEKKTIRFVILSDENIKNGKVTLKDIAAQKEYVGVDMSEVSGILKNIKGGK